MFGIGGSELIVILIVALLFLGPDKLPDAAKTISKGIRDLKRGQREIQQTIENDETIGGALRDLRSALRGEEPPPKRAAKPTKPAPKTIDIAADDPPAELAEAAAKHPVALELPHTIGDPNAPLVPAASDAQLSLDLPPEKPAAVKLPPEAGEADPDHREAEGDREELAALIKPASGTIAKAAAPAVPKSDDHG